MACLRPSQRLNEPTTLTRSAFGAQTAKRVPVEPVERRHVRTELVIDPLVIALAEQVQVELGQLRREEIRIVLERLRAGAVADLQPIRLERTAIRYPPLEQSQLVQLRQLGDALRVVFPAHA